MKREKLTRIEKTLLAEINRLNDSGLRKLIGECQRLTNTNCGWIMYELKDIVMELAKLQRRWLKKQAQKGDHP